MHIPLVLVLSSLAFSQAAFADGLYKCKDAKGGTSYQQAACPTTSKTEGIRTYAPVAPSARNSWTAQRDVLQQQQAQRQRQYETEVPRVRASAGNRVADQERRALSSQIDSQISDLGSLNSRGKRELAADLRAQQTALATNTPYQPPVRQASADPSPVYRAPQPSTLTDQNGRSYTQPPGSGFATDNQTGKQCFVNGVFIHC